MRDFNFKDESNTSAADIRPLETPPEAVILDETPIPDQTPHEDTLRPFHVEEEEEASNLPKIAGAVVVGLLIVGGGLYAYETSFANRAPVKTVAMNTTAPVKTAATAPLPAANPDVTPPTATPALAAPVKSAATAPVTEPVQKTAAMTPGVGIGPSNDPAIDAPMSFTADNAPPAELAGPSVQTAAIPSTPNQVTAMQQPISPPDVGNTSQPTAAIAANQASGVSLPVAPLAPAQSQPAQIQPAPIQPSPVQ
jgi:hypothetical protein